MKILLTNDDGIDAPGLAALYHAIRHLGAVTVAAPLQVQSATSHAVTFHRPIRTSRRTIAAQELCPGGFCGVAVDGRPADCVKLAMHRVFGDEPDLVVSGMNKGANVGINTLYSGTVGAAREAAIYGVPAVAVSLHIGQREGIRWSDAARHAADVIADLLAAGPLPAHNVVNINVPCLDGGAEPRGVRVVPMSTSRIIEEYTATDGDNGDRHYMAADTFDFHTMHPDTDVEALFAGYISVTPLHFDLTDHSQLQQLSAQLTTTPTS